MNMSLSMSLSRIATAFTLAASIVWRVHRVMVDCSCIQEKDGTHYRTRM
jgi:hypothetical protein